MAYLDSLGRRGPQEVIDADLRFEKADATFERERWLAVLTMVAAVGAWELASHAGWISRLFFPPPSDVWGTLVRTARSGALWTHVGATLGRVAAGMTTGGVLGLMVGLVLGWSARLRAFVDPFIATFHPIPKVAMLPFIMMVFGVGEPAKIVVVAIGVFFPLLLTSMAGVRQIQASYFDVAAVYGATRRQIFAHVVLPGSLPFVLTGVRLAFNIGLLMTLAVELVTAQRGLGKMIWFAWETMRIEELYAALAMIAAIGIGFNLLLSWLTERLVPWRAERVR